MQKTLVKNKEIEYHSEFKNDLNNTEQHIRLSDGCFRSCWNCYAPTKKIWYELPEIKRNKVVFYDMNFLFAYPEPLKVIRELGEKKVNGKVVYYDFWCGIDFTLLTPEITKALKKARFGRFNNKRNYIGGLRFAWDRSIKEQEQIWNVFKMLDEAGYNRKNHQCFMLVNGKIAFKECTKKLQVLMHEHIQVCDCWYDKQKRGSVDPMFSWKDYECKIFGHLCRDHNEIIQGNGKHREYLNKPCEVSLLSLMRKKPNKETLLSNDAKSVMDCHLRQIPIKEVRKMGIEEDIQTIKHRVTALDNKLDELIKLLTLSKFNNIVEDDVEIDKATKEGSEPRKSIERHYTF